MEVSRKIEIGKRIEKIRVEKLDGMSQVQLGRAIGTSGQNMGLVINGKGSLSLDKAIELCNFAKVSMDYLFLGVGDGNLKN
ncbi:MAG: helix-turn-helix transcriptional regulator [bacterium]